MQLTAEVDRIGKGIRTIGIRTIGIRHPGMDLLPTNQEASSPTELSYTALARLAPPRAVERKGGT